MQVETFECSETASEPIEACEEAVGLIDELGLEGQQKFVKRAAEPSGFDSRSPYRQMTQDELFAYMVLCPDQKRLSQYDASPIPLRVLQVAAHAQSLGVFKELYVWDKVSSEVKDPVLVALDGEAWSSQTKRFILARWGEELEHISVLMKKALVAKREALQQQLANCSRAVELVTDTQLIRFPDGQVVCSYT